MGAAPAGYTLIGVNTQGKAIKSDETGVAKPIETTLIEQNVAENTVILGASGGSASVSVNGHYQLPNYAPMVGQVLGLSGSTVEWVSGGGGGGSLTSVLSSGNSTGNYDIVVVNGQQIISNGGAPASLNFPSDGVIEIYANKNNGNEYIFIQSQAAYNNSGEPSISMGAGGYIDILSSYQINGVTHSYVMINGRGFRTFVNYTSSDTVKTIYEFGVSGPTYVRISFVGTDGNGDTHAIIGEISAAVANLPNNGSHQFIGSIDKVKKSTLSTADINLDIVNGNVRVRANGDSGVNLTWKLNIMWTDGYSSSGLSSAYYQGPFTFNG